MNGAVEAVVTLFRDCECDGGSIFLMVQSPSGKTGLVNLSQTEGAKTRRAVLEWAEDRLKTPANPILDAIDRQIEKGWGE